jgi:hypothetical protein
MDIEQLELKIEVIRNKLFEVREGRPRPYKDDKVLTDWNGLMIAAFALGSQVFDEPRYAEAAMKAADFIIDKMIASEGRPCIAIATVKLPSRGISTIMHF